MRTKTTTRAPTTIAVERAPLLDQDGAPPYVADIFSAPGSRGDYVVLFGAEVAKWVMPPEGGFWELYHLELGADGFARWGAMGAGGCDLWREALAGQGYRLRWTDLPADMREHVVALVEDAESDDAGMYDAHGDGDM